MTTGTERMRISSGGGVSIGTATGAGSILEGYKVSRGEYFVGIP
jgi:hypothetical protein